MSDVRAQLLAGGWWQRSLVFARRGERLHAMLTSCGVQEAHAPAYDWDGLSRGRAEFVVFQYSLAGRGVLTWDGRDWPVPPGSLMLVRIPHEHRYRVHPEAGFWQFLYICLTGREVMRAVGQVHDLVGPVFVLLADGPILAAAGEIAERVGGKQLASSYPASALAYRLAMALLEEVKGAGTETPARRVTQPAADHCREHVSDDVSVGALARLCGLSQWHFSRLFKAEHGLSPGAFLQVERIREAARLLQDTDLPLKVVAERCGFADANYFGKAFRQHTGVSPGAFRRSGV